MKMWYVLYTKPDWERRVSDLLNRKGLEIFCPFNRVRGDRHARRRFEIEPLFRSYVFAKVTEDQRAILKQTSGVINLVYWLDSPAVCSDGEISALRSFLKEHPSVRLEKAPVSLPLHQTADGFLKTREKNSNGWPVCIPMALVPSLGYIIVAEDAASVRLVDVAYSEQEAWDFPVPVQA